MGQGYQEVGRQALPHARKTELQTFTAPAGLGDVEFGYRVRIGDGNLLLIGAQSDNAVYYVDLDDHTPVPAPVPLSGSIGLAVLLALLVAAGSGAMVWRRSSAA